MDIECKQRRSSGKLRTGNKEKISRTKPGWGFELNPLIEKKKKKSETCMDKNQGAVNTKEGRQKKK